MRTGGKGQNMESDIKKLGETLKDFKNRSDVVSFLLQIGNVTIMKNSWIPQPQRPVSEDGHNPEEDIEDLNQGKDNIIVREEMDY